MVGDQTGSLCEAHESTALAGEFFRALGYQQAQSGVKRLALTCKAPLLAFAAVAFDLMSRFLEVAGLFRIEFSLGSADLANQCVEVVRVLFVPDERRKDEFLNGHRDLLWAQHTRGSAQIPV
jgi:hypothetical protein